MKLTVSQATMATATMVEANDRVDGLPNANDVFAASHFFVD